MDVLIRKQIRSIYKDFNPQASPELRRSPYSLGIEWDFTPIEYNVWGDIRYLGLPLYPQFPVGPYFVDFGDPVRRICIEVDSVAWHTDKKKDLERQRKIEAMGWLVFRIPSKLTYRNKDEFCDEDGNLVNEKYWTECVEGILTDIYGKYGHRNFK